MGIFSSFSKKWVYPKWVYVPNFLKAWVYPNWYILKYTQKMEIYPKKKPMTAHVQSPPFPFPNIREQTCPDDGDGYSLKWLKPSITKD